VSAGQRRFERDHGGLAVHVDLPLALVAATAVGQIVHVATEIERKFLVRDRRFLDGDVGVPFRQGYLSRDPDRTVRVRVAGEQGFLTIKGRPNGASRPEFEFEIPLDEARDLLGLCAGLLIEKTRHRIDHAGLTWDVDVFSGANDGLIIAEVELPSEDHAVEMPDWVGEEVTGDVRYYNSRLVERPFSTWGS
jgi:CYTH domain-containing protein